MILTKIYVPERFKKKDISCNLNSILMSCTERSMHLNIVLNYTLTALRIFVQMLYI